MITVKIKWDTFIISFILDSLGELAEAQGDWTESARWFEKALSVYHAINAPYARVTGQNLERVRARLREETERGD